MTVYGVGVGVSQGIGEAASMKLNTVTHSYSDGNINGLYPGYRAWAGLGPWWPL